MSGNEPWTYRDSEQIKQAINAFTKALFVAVPSARQTTQSAASPWEFAKVLDAEQAAEKMASEKQRLRDLKLVSGVADGGEVLTLNDIPVAFGEKKRYRDRQVTLFSEG